MCPLLCAGLGPLSTARRTRRQSGGSSPRSGSSTWCITSGVRGVTLGRPPAWGAQGASPVLSPQPTGICSPGRRQGMQPGGRGAGMRTFITLVSGTPTPFGDPLPVLGTPCPHLSLLSFPSPADPDHGITDNDSPEDLPPAVIGGPWWGCLSAPPGAPCLCPGPAGEGLGGSAPPGSQLSPPPHFGMPWWG